ncbi:Hypothetical protein SSCIU_00898 [Mammaliicoccus sciuri]|nr:Hypothetical protein SSCIU_00898 [Mammaliicoccus sciuri]
MHLWPELLITVSVFAPLARTAFKSVSI